MHIALDRRPAPTARGAASRPSAAAVGIAAALALFAGWAHLVYMSSHLREWWAYGLFFLVAGIAQAVFAVALVRWPLPRVALAGIAGNLAIVALYVDTRTIGVPLGPHAHAIEQAAAPDLLTTGCEIVLIVLLLTMVAPAPRRRVINLLVVAAVALWAMRLTGHLA
jgi:hypothetical protein